MIIFLSGTFSIGITLFGTYINRGTKYRNTYLNSFDSLLLFAIIDIVDSIWKGGYVLVDKLVLTLQMDKKKAGAGS